MGNSEREKVWQERVLHWQASGLSQRAYALEQGFPVRQVGYSLAVVSLPRDLHAQECAHAGAHKKGADPFG